jgi:general secretion pathway protein E
MATASTAPSLGLPVLEEIPPTEVCLRFVERIPISFARRFGVIGLNDGDGGVRVAVSELRDIAVLDAIAVQLGLVVEPVIASLESITTAINQAYSAQAAGAETVIGQIEPAEADALIAAFKTDGDLLDNATSAPVVKLVNLVLLEAVKRRASDVHVQPFDDRVQVRLRIDGVLYDYVAPPRSLLDEIVSRIKVIGRMDIAEKRLPQDGRTTVSVGDRIIDLRISSLPTSHGERVVVRLLDKSARLYRLPELGMNDRDLDRFRVLIRRTHGIILVTGPTGSGKSTTLYAALQELNCKELNILTLEDPIEYQLPGISQSQVSDKKGMTFARGLRTVLRQDPDVIMVGEIRDEETARMAVQSALTGHLVFSTLHTNDAAGAVTRLLDLGIEPYLVASSLLAVLAQRLVRTVCPTCASADPLGAADARRLGVELREPLPQVRCGSGCADCLNTGYYERTGVFELLIVDDAIRSLVLQRAEAAAVRRSAVSAGMATLRQDGVCKLLAGRTTVDEVLRVTHEELRSQN